MRRSSRFEILFLALPRMKVLRHRLHDDDRAVKYVRSPNVGGELRAKFLIVHFTAGSSAESSVAWLSNPGASASAHLVIGRDGSITQLVPFNRVACHAGTSEWHGLRGMNQHSIGIELDNAGRLERQGERWRSWFGTVYADEDVMVARHPNLAEVCGWHVYTEAQLLATFKVCQTIIEKYALLGIAGHDEISPGRKFDPGPAFPLDSFRARLLGRAGDAPPRDVTTAVLNIRSGPGIGFDRLPEGPLAAGVAVEVMEHQGLWRLVSVTDTASGSGPVEGWVHSHYLRPSDSESA